MKKNVAILVLIVILTGCLCACYPSVYFSRGEITEIALETFEWDEVIANYPLHADSAFTEPDEFSCGAFLFIGKKDGEERCLVSPYWKKEQDKIREVEWPFNASFCEIAEHLKTLITEDDDIPEFDYTSLSLYDGTMVEHVYDNVEELDVLIVIRCGMQLAMQIDGNVVYKTMKSPNYNNQ